VSGKYTFVYILGAIVLLAGSGWAYLHFAAPANAGPAPLTPEAKAYVRYLKLGPVEMKAEDSYVNQTITDIQGDVTNTGNRTLRSVVVTCVFYNSYGEVVLRERASILKASGAPAKPGDTRHYRLAFDDIPAGWNNRLPQLVIAQIGFD
jgi:hypothetical protein